MPRPSSSCSRPRSTRRTSTDNGIDYITPIPQHAWDKTSVNGTIGNYDMTPSGAKAVVAYLQKAASDTTTYTTNPLWKVIDGPWELQTFGGAELARHLRAQPELLGPQALVRRSSRSPLHDRLRPSSHRSRPAPSTTATSRPRTSRPSRRSRARATTSRTIPTWGFDYIIPNTEEPPGRPHPEPDLHAPGARPPHGPEHHDHTLHGRLRDPDLRADAGLPQGQPLRQPVRADEPLPLLRLGGRASC